MSYRYSIQTSTPEDGKNGWNNQPQDHFLWHCKVLWNAFYYTGLVEKISIYLRTDSIFLSKTLTVLPCSQLRGLLFFNWNYSTEKEKTIFMAAQGAKYSLFTRVRHGKRLWGAWKSLGNCCAGAYRYGINGMEGDDEVDGRTRIEYRGRNHQAG
jgi:hypothetical protein